MSTPDLDATFAFVDLAGFTAVTEAHGDREAVAIIQAFRARAQEVLGPDDELVKTIGDAVMLRFPTPDARGGRTPGAHPARDRDTRRRTPPPRRRPPRARRRPRRRLLRSRGQPRRPRRRAGRGRPAARDERGRLGRPTPRRSGQPPRHTRASATSPTRSTCTRYASAVESFETATDLVCHMRVPTADAHAISLEWNGRRHHFCGLPCVARFAASPDAFLARPVPV